MLETLQPWTRLREVIGILSPLFVFSLISSVVIYFAFFVVPHRSSARNFKPVNNAEEPSNASDLDEFGYMGALSYVFVASIFGVILGMLAKLLGGFRALSGSAAAPADTLIGAIGSALVLAVGVAAGLFADAGRIAIRRYVGAIALLASFLVSGFYWQFLVGILGSQ